jgi:hypothetical protein
MDGLICHIFTNWFRVVNTGYILVHRIVFDTMKKIEKEGVYY